MHNSPLHPLFNDSNRSGDEDLIAPASPWRVYLIGAAFTILVVGIMGRVIWVQLMLPERYLAALEVTTTETEILSARDGRILAGGLVLAADVELYAVQVHYRWLQNPCDPAWLKQQIRNRLSRQERRDEDLVVKTEQQIQSERRMLRHNLRKLLNVTECIGCSSLLPI